MSLVSGRGEKRIGESKEVSLLNPLKRINGITIPERILAGKGINWSKVHGQIKKKKVSQEK